MKSPTSWIKSLAATATLCATFGALSSAQAATYQFQATLNDGFFVTGAPEIGREPMPDFYKGTFSFDDSLLSGVGLESLGAEANLEVSLAEDPRVDETIDARFPEFPTVNFQDGELLGLDWFAVYHPFTSVPELNYPGDFVRIEGTQLSDGFDPTFYTPEDEPRSPIYGSGTVEYTAVPEPSSVLGLAIAAFGLGYLHKKSRPTSTLALK